MVTAAGCTFYRNIPISSKAFLCLDLLLALFIQKNPTKAEAVVQVTDYVPLYFDLLQVCEYIAEELYKDNYSLRQRIDMLDVLATSAQSLAAADKATPLEAEPILHGEALERKTRRFPSSKPLLAKPNRFASVATQFFFPLLSHFQR